MIKAFITAISISVFFIPIVVLLSACNGAHQRSDIDTPVSGVINISVDETYKPVIDGEIKVFEALYPKATVIAHYKPETDCLRDLVKDPATRLVIVTRGLSDQEERFFQDTLKYVPISDEVADDAVAIIVNSQSADSLLTPQSVRSILDGSAGNKVTAVFDGYNATSTVRYAQDSILRGAPLNKNNVMAVSNSQAVIDYVAAHDNVLGFVGVNWIGNPDDPDQLSFVKKVKIAAIECSACGNNIFVKPYQANIIYKRYPFVRGIYYILKENYQGLGYGFTNFLSLERGQLIFRRAYLAPAKIDFTWRNVSL
jgi:phosphate transport system substrate-binding protein